MRLFKDPTPTQQILLQLEQRSLLNARIKSGFYANEVLYQEGIIQLLKDQLNDENITLSPPRPGFQKPPQCNTAYGIAATTGGSNG